MGHLKSTTKADHRYDAQRARDAARVALATNAPAPAPKKIDKRLSRKQRDAGVYPRILDMAKAGEIVASDVAERFGIERGTAGTWLLEMVESGTLVLANPERLPTEARRFAIPPEPIPEQITTTLPNPTP